jgi:CheY-like chemotaxis protein
MGTILVVDDDPGITKVLKVVLERAGHRVLVEHDGAHALLTAHRDRPDVILLDEVMPVLDGSSTLRALKSDPNTDQIPVVMVTVHNGNGYTQRVFELGVVMHVVKPFDPQEILDICDRLVPAACDN